MLTNRVELVVVMFAAWRIGAALTPINPSLTAGEAAFQIEDSGARLLVHEGAALDIAGVTMVDVTTLPATPIGGDSVIETAPDTLALLIYTSGTTGKPKGVMLDHANLTAMVAMITTALDLTAADHCLLILPLFHVNGIVVSVLSPLAAGGCTTVTGRFSPSTFFDTVEAVRPTYFSAVPAIYAMLSALPDDVDPDTSSVRFAICGAAPMPAELIAPVRAAVRHDDRRGLRPLRVHLRRDHQPDRRAPQARHRGAAASRPGGRPARQRREAHDRRSGRGDRPRPQRHAGLPQQARGDGSHPRRTAGCTPATSATSTPTATSSSSTG